MAKSTRGVRPPRCHPVAVLVPLGFQRLRQRDVAPDLSREARARLAMLDWHRSHGGNVSRTARHFGYSRPTVYRWLARFERPRLETLEDRGSGPHPRRRPPATMAQPASLKALSAPYPRWVKNKLADRLDR